MTNPPHTLPTTAESQQQPDYANEHIFQRNRLPPRAYDIPETAILLSGQWNFHYAPTALHAPSPGSPKSISVPTDSSPADPIVSAGTAEGVDPVEDALPGGAQWSQITVPGHWQLQGHGNPQYTNVVYPFPVNPPFPPSQNPTGSYTKKFHVPPAWSAHASLRLRFEGVDSAFHVWVNGHAVGYHQGSRNPSEFDVSHCVRRPGENEVHVRVYQWSDGSYLEDQDQWWLSGIFRHVYLLALPVARIEDFFVQTRFDSDYRDATLDVSLRLELPEDIAVDLGLTLRDADDQKTDNIQHAIFSPGNERHTHHTLHVASPRKWTAETPSLYHLEIALLERSSRDVLQTIHQRVGFRQVDIKNGLLTVNGKPVLLQGVNRHDHHPRFGRAVPLSFIREDLLLMKRHNINALRCSHYPPDPRMLELCDELGLWVMDEADLECHGFYDAVARPLDIPEEMDYEERKKLAFPQAAAYTSDNPAWKAQYVDRMAAVVHRDKNHPSVIIWSLGNEAFYGQNHRAMYDYVKSVDPTRPVHYEGDAKALSADMFSYMYPSVERLLKLAATEGVVDGEFAKPIVLCEYAHAMGNGPGNLQGYQDAFRQVDRIQGGFIWEWANHGLLKEDKSGQKIYGYGGDFGEVVHDGTFVMDGLCFSNHTATPGLIEYKKVIEPVKVTGGKDAFWIENLYDFADLSHLTVLYKVESFKKRSNLLHSGTLDIPEILPGEKKSLPYPRPLLELSTTGAVWFTVSFRLRQAQLWADAGHEIAWYQEQFTMASPPSFMKLPSMINCPELRTRTSPTTWTIGDCSFEIRFDRSTGMPQSWISGGQVLLQADPITASAMIPAFWRAPTDNDRPRDDPYWKRFGVNLITSQLRSTAMRRISPHTVEITSRAFLSPPILDWGFEATTVYLIAANESLSAHVSLMPTGKFPATLPRIGLDVRTTKTLTAVEYQGLGPGESYPDKQAAQKMGIYRSSVSSLVTPYEVPQENGNRMAASWIRLADAAGRGLVASRIDDGEQRFSWAAGHHAPDTLDKAAHPCDLVEEDAVLLRLDVATAGVGSGACGPGIAPDVQVKCDKVEFGFKVQRVTGCE